MSGLGPPGAVEAVSGAILDTSGAVHLVFVADDGWPDTIRWPDLSPFEQGYVEAMLSANAEALAWVRCGALSGPHEGFSGFSDLAPETLAAIRKDCAGLRPVPSPPDFDDDDYERAEGRRAWEWRQAGRYPNTFPPLTVTLGDDGKVRTSPVDDTSDRQSIPGRHSSES